MSILRGPIAMMPRVFEHVRKGFTLIEVLCVMAIIAILTSLMLPAIGKALRKVQGLGGHLGGPGGIQMRIDEVVTHYTRYRVAHPTHEKLSRKAFASELQLSAIAEAWLNLKCVEYHPFASSDPIEQPAIIVYPSEGSGSGDKSVIFRIRDLMAP